MHTIPIRSALFATSLAMATGGCADMNQIQRGTATGAPRALGVGVCWDDTPTG